MCFFPPDHDCSYTGNETGKPQPVWVAWQTEYQRPLYFTHTGESLWSGQRAFIHAKMGREENMMVFIFYKAISCVLAFKQLAFSVHFQNVLLYLTFLITKGANVKIQSKCPFEVEEI